MTEVVLTNKRVKHRKEPFYKGFVIGFVSQLALMLTPLVLIYILICGSVVAVLVGFSSEFLSHIRDGKQYFDVTNILAACVGGVLASVFMAALISIANLLMLVIQAL